MQRLYVARQIVRTRSGFTFFDGSLIDAVHLPPDEIDALLARGLIELAPEQYRVGTVEAFDGPSAPACAEKVS